jgi:hypothetical protein
MNVFRHSDTLLKRSAGLALSLVFGVTIFAAQLDAAEIPPLEADRPDVTEGALTVPRGSIQLETGFTRTKSCDITDYSLGELLVRIGLMEMLELRTGINSFVLSYSGDDSTSGREDVSLSAKIRCLKSPESFNLLHPDLGFIFGTTFPSGSGVYREEDPVPFGTLAAGWSLPWGFFFSTSTSLSFPNDDNGRYRVVNANFSLGYELAGKVDLFIEHYLESTEHDTILHFLDSGITFLAMPNFQLDFRMGISLNGERSWLMGAGAVYRILDFF